MRPASVARALTECDFRARRYCRETKCMTCRCQVMVIVLGHEIHPVDEPERLS